MERVQIKYNSYIQYWDILHSTDILNCIIDKVRSGLNNLDRGHIWWQNIMWYLLVIGAQWLTDRPSSTLSLSFLLLVVVSIVASIVVVVSSRVVVLYCDGWEERREEEGGVVECWDDSVSVAGGQRAAVYRVWSVTDASQPPPSPPASS